MGKQMIAKCGLGGAVVVTALCVINGCASHASGGPDAVSGDHSPPVIQIRADLEDGATRVGQGPFNVWYSGSGAILDDATLRRLSAGISLRTWPEGAVIPMMVSNGPILPSNNNVPGTRAAVKITPEALEDRWYSIQFGAPEEDVISSQSFAGGVWGVRIRPGSHPAVRLIEFCDGKFILAFSESVTTANAAEIFTVTQNGQPVSCPINSVGSQDLHAFCSIGPGPVTVTIAADTAQSADGAPLAAGRWNIDAAMLPSVEPGCVGYVIPL
jgi:hypothetical protein